jgi:cell wall-associated NlpC family hydrolase
MTSGARAFGVDRIPAAILAIALLGSLLAGCGSVTPRPPPAPAAARVVLGDPTKGSEAALFSLALIDRGYRFGGNNPEAGLDCSGMVSYVYRQVAGIDLPHNAARIAQLTRAIPREALRAGDLVFFNTLDRPFSHVGIYVGDDRFVHAPNSGGRVRIDRLNEHYYAKRFEAARSLLPD